MFTVQLSANRVNAQVVKTDVQGGTEVMFSTQRIEEAYVALQFFSEREEREQAGQFDGFFYGGIFKIYVDFQKLSIPGTSLKSAMRYWVNR